MLKYKDFSLIEPNVVQTEKISKIIKDQGSIFHEIELNNIVSTNFSSQLYYLVDNPDNISCLAPIHIIKHKFGLKKYNFQPLGDIPYGGFVGKFPIDIEKINIGPFESIKYSGFPYVDDKLHKNDDKIEVGETNMVDLSLSEDDIFNNSIHSKRRNMIRKAIKLGISTKSYYTERGLEVFWPMLENLHQKLGYNDLTHDYYSKLLKNYGIKKQAFVLVAYKDDQPISGVLVLGNNNYMHYYKGAGSFEVKNEGQGELLQWEAIKIAKSLGTNYYDLCNLDKVKLPSIYRFKTGISQNIINYPKYTRSNLGFKVVNKLNQLL